MSRLFIISVVLICMAAVSSAAQFSVAGVQATRGPVNSAASASGFQVRFSSAPEIAASAQSASKCTVSIGIFDEAKPAVKNAINPAMWCCYR